MIWGSIDYGLPQLWFKEASTVVYAIEPVRNGQGKRCRGIYSRTMLHVLLRGDGCPNAPEEDGAIERDLAAAFSM